MRIRAPSRAATRHSLVRPPPAPAICRGLAAPPMTKTADAAETSLPDPDFESGDLSGRTTTGTAFTGSVTDDPGWGRGCCFDHSADGLRHPCVAPQARMNGPGAQGSDRVVAEAVGGVGVTGIPQGVSLGITQFFGCSLPVGQPRPTNFSLPSPWRPGSSSTIAAGLS